MNYKTIETRTSAIRIKNFLKLIEEHFDGSVHAFAKKHNISPTPYYMILNGNRLFGAQVARKVEQLLNLSPGQLDIEEGAAEYGKVAHIPTYSNHLSPDKSSIFEQEIVRHHAVDRNEIHTFGGKEENLCIFEIQGDSMKPLLREGQKIIVDTSQLEITDNRIYAISVNNEVFIRRMFKELGTGKLIARSENESYPENHFNSKDELKIIGRVVYSIGKIL
ncbi:MAG: helix-turn-helix transcriptional regulator [Neisseriaceae bacterium]